MSMFHYVSVIVLRILLVRVGMVLPCSYHHISFCSYKSGCLPVASQLKKGIYIFILHAFAEEFLFPDFSCLKVWQRTQWELQTSTMTYLHMSVYRHTNMIWSMRFGSIDYALVSKAIWNVMGYLRCIWQVHKDDPERAEDVHAEGVVPWHLRYC